MAREVKPWPITVTMEENGVIVDTRDDKACLTMDTTEETSMEVKTKDVVEI